MERSEHGASRRRSLIVLPELQRRLIRQCSIWPFVMLVAAILLGGLAWRRLLMDFLASGAEVASLGWLLVAFAALIGAVAWVVLHQSVVFSNRIAGPIHRIHQVLENIRAGDLDQRLHLREQDLLLETAEQLNLTLDHLQRQRQREAATALPNGPPAVPATEKQPVPV